LNDPVVNQQGDMMKKWISTGLALGMAALLPWVADAQTVSPPDGASHRGGRHAAGDPSRTHAGKGQSSHAKAKREERLAALRAKQISGSLSNREQRQLARLEKWSRDRAQKPHRHAREG